MVFVMTDLPSVTLNVIASMPSATIVSVEAVMTIGISGAIYSLAKKVISFEMIVSFFLA